jgi:hypothetical protein
MRVEEKIERSKNWGGKGMRTYNNGVVAHRYYEGEQPDGFVLGMLPRTEEQRKKSNAKRVQTTIKKYGVANVAQNKEVQERAVQTNRERYGVDFAQQLEETKQKIKKTNMERYGTLNGKPLRPKVEKPKKEKRVKKEKPPKDTRKGHYYNNGVLTKKIREGDEIPEGFVRGMLLSAEVKKARGEKAKATFLKKYGVDSPSKLESVKAKARATNLKKYGVVCSAQAESVKEKIKATNLKRYGVECSFQSDEVKEKIKATNLKRYGVDNAFKSEEIKKKIMALHRKNLGVDYPMQSKEVREKSIKTSLEKYGTEYPNQSDIVKQHIKESNLRIYGVEYPAQSEEIKEKTRKTNMERYGVPCFFMTLKEWEDSNDSKPNRDFAEELTRCGIKFEREYRLDWYSYDFKVGNVLVEINPTVTHNTSWSPYGNPKEENYHKDKTQMAWKNGFSVIHVFDWDSESKILKLLSKRAKVYARKCEIREVSQEDTSEYLNQYHLQNTCRGQKIRLGLYYKDELVSLMTFGKPRYNKNYEYELLRYCANYYVVGGAEKLFNHFVKTYNPCSVVSYCDLSKFSGKVYDNLGFALLKINSPRKHWYSYKEGRHITGSFLLQHGYDRIFHENYGKGTSNEELIAERGYFPVYDCGQATYVWKKDKE